MKVALIAVGAESYIFLNGLSCKTEELLQLVIWQKLRKRHSPQFEFDSIISHRGRILS